MLKISTSNNAALKGLNKNRYTLLDSPIIPFLSLIEEPPFLEIPLSIQLTDTYHLGQILFQNFMQKYRDLEKLARKAA